MDLTRALPDSVRQQSSPFISHTELPECEQFICMGMITPEIRHKAKLVDMKMNSPNDIDACHNLISLPPFKLENAASLSLDFFNLGFFY
jgi:hypothetical protein